jgi:hypothetical protein
MPVGHAERRNIVFHGQAGLARAGNPSTESDVEALIAEHHDDFLRMPEIQTSRLVITSRQQSVRAYLVQFQFG